MKLAITIKAGYRVSYYSLPVKQEPHTKADRRHGDRPNEFEAQSKSVLHFAWVWSKRALKYTASVEVAEKHVRVNAQKQPRPGMKVVRWNKRISRVLRGGRE
jgi:galactose mutarotase-like enzyme